MISHPRCEKFVSSDQKLEISSKPEPPQAARKYPKLSAWPGEDSLHQLLHSQRHAHNLDILQLSHTVTGCTHRRTRATAQTTSLRSHSEARAPSPPRFKIKYAVSQLGLPALREVMLQWSISSFQVIRTCIVRTRGIQLGCSYSEKSRKQALKQSSRKISVRCNFSRCCFSSNNKALSFPGIQRTKRPTHLTLRAEMFQRKRTSHALQDVC